MSSNAARMIERMNKDIDSLPIALAKAGYDVWMGNGRGTRFSSEHETIDWEKNEEEYWDFSFPELGTYDLPAALSMVKEETGGKKIRYYGYSLGTTQMFYALQHPETKQFMEDTLHQYVAVAPVFYPDADGFMDVSYANFELMKVFAEETDLQH